MLRCGDPDNGEFQSTRPRRARPGSTRGMGSPTGFNPRARVGRDRGRDESTTYVLGFNPRARVGRDIQGVAAGNTRVTFQSTRPRRARLSHHNSLRDKDFFYEIREPMSPVDPKGTGQVATTQKANEINKLLKCEPSRESRAA